MTVVDFIQKVLLDYGFSESWASIVSNLAIALLILVSWLGRLSSYCLPMS